ncbi:MAG: bifunctional adenosylcobinamide kinase/adenosylcobinamide-phosphate guanylyltransferase [Chloroflexi bacterium]|nr:MAG: bifunctional adenosylcobinamide kinase/adenosylcobinamide-phosphate guanylyltransferase [Chloroflexota bacterium]
MSENQEQSLPSSEEAVVPRLILILGGARSGKSAFAERLAAGSGRSVAFIATATAGDDEMRSRIARHRASRPKGWYTLEESLDLASAVRRAGELADVLLLDCVTLWLGNVLLQESVQHEKDDEVEFHTAGRLFNERALKECEALLAVVKSLSPDKTLIVVTNEVGLGIVPAYPLGRLYRDTLGYINQRLAQAADRVYLMMAGMAVNIKRLHEEASL